MSENAENLQIGAYRFDLWLEMPEGGPDDDFHATTAELFGWLTKSCWQPEIPSGMADNWWFCQGLLPNLAFLSLGVRAWAAHHKAIYRRLEPDSPTFPPETGISDDDDLEP